MKTLTPLEILYRIEESHNFESPSLRQHLTNYDKLQQNVKRYFELQDMWNWKQRHEWTNELNAEYEALRKKLKEIFK